MRNLAAGVLAVVVLASATGCSGGDDKAAGGKDTRPTSTFPTPDSATIQGRLLAVGGPAPGDPRPMKRGTVTLTGADGSRIQGQVDADGRFAIGVSPGTYRISARSKDYQGGAADCLPAKQPGPLDKGTTTTVDVVCSLK
ncbi:MAG: carboxypeptidase regulatory-like domain-containing protein [Nocardioidaceae bacterium]|nr:carboxypeptidase regulatory-like domain-containing protein [Nocardioidaceae bacterium]